MLHKVDILVIKTYIFFKQISFRRDKEFCHECRFCCTLSVCTIGDKHIFKDSKNDTEKIKSQKSGAILAKTGFLTDMKMYKAPDFRCLKPKKRLSPSKWPHYYMPEFRAASNKAELKKVEEVPFDKYFLNMEDPKVFKDMTDPLKGPSLWIKTYGMDFASLIPIRNMSIYNGHDMYRVSKSCLGKISNKKPLTLHYIGGGDIKKKV